MFYGPYHEKDAVGIGIDEVRPDDVLRAEFNQ